MAKNTGKTSEKDFIENISSCRGSYMPTAWYPSRQDYDPHRFKSLMAIFEKEKESCLLKFREDVKVRLEIENDPKSDKLLDAVSEAVGHDRLERIYNLVKSIKPLISWVQEKDLKQ